jgi:Double zinc ribbon
MCEYCGTDPPCNHPTCSKPGSGCSCSLSGPARCPTCGHECLPWYFGLGVEGAPDSIRDFLGGAGTESPGFDEYPATKAQLVSAARSQIADSDEPNLADVDWLSQRLPDSTFRDPGEVFVALQGPVTCPALEGPNWYRAGRSGAIPLGTRLEVAPNTVAVLLGRDRTPADEFSTGEYTLTRESAPIAAGRSRPPSPGFSHGVLEGSVVFCATRDQEGILSFSGRTRTSERFWWSATVRFALTEPKKFLGSRVATSFATPLPLDRLVSEVASPELNRVVQSQDAKSLSANPSMLESAMRAAMQAAGFTVRGVESRPAGTNPITAGLGPGGVDPFANMPPEVRAMVQARMEEAMRRRAAQGAPPSPRSPAPMAPSPSTALPTLDCPACRAPNPPTGKFCHNCGAPLVTKRSCPSCGREVAAGIKFCGNCGTRMP